MKVICGTGHRPDKLGGYDNAILKKLITFAEGRLIEINPTHVISGVALGWDTALAIAAIRLNIPLTAAVPFAGQELRWQPEAIARYNKILSKCARVEIVSPGGYGNPKMQIRNEWMVDRSDMVLALWNGSSGGTGNCVKYAQSTKTTLVNVWQAWVEYK
jgi:uncharacterized phage-like protein YoqJ